MDISTALRRALVTAVVATMPVVAKAQPASAPDSVDVELILAVDVSLSMSPEELEIQRHGYAAALIHPNVIEAIEQGVNGRIAVTYVEWAGQTSQRVVVPWTVIGSLEDAEAFVSRLGANPPSSARRTSIASALLFAADLFAEVNIAACGAWSTFPATAPTTRGLRSTSHAMR